MDNWGILFKVLSAFSASCLAWKFPYRNASTREVCTPESMEMACAISVLRRIRSTIQTARCRSTSVRCSCMIVKMGCTASAWFSTYRSSHPHITCHIHVHPKYQNKLQKKKTSSMPFSGTYVSKQQRASSLHSLIYTFYTIIQDYSSAAPLEAEFSSSSQIQFTLLK